MAVSPFVEKLKSIVVDQHARFHTHTETDDVLGRQILKYWKEGVGINQTSVQPAWSSVFVSWCFKQAGATQDEFRFHPRHAGYVFQAIKHQKEGKGVFQAVPIDAEPVAVGDIIVRNREGGRVSYDKAGERDDYPSHGDIVVGFEEFGGTKTAKVIGGNVSNTRKLKEIRLTSKGFVEQESTEPYICVVKNRKYFIKEDDGDMVRFIKEPNKPQVFTNGICQRIIESEAEAQEVARRFAPHLVAAGGHIIVEQKEAGFMDGVPVVG